MGDYNLSLEIKTVGAKEALDSLNLLDKKGRQIVEDVAGATGRHLGDVASAYERGGAGMRAQLERVAEGHRDVIAEIEKQEKAAARMYGGGAAGLGRVRQGLVSLAASATDTTPTLDRLGASLLSMTVGAGLTLGVTAGIAAIAMAYRFLTKDASDAAEAQEKALDALKKWKAERDAGVGGAFAVTVNTSTAARDAAKAALDAQMARVAGFTEGSEGRAIAEKLLPGLRKAYDDAALLVTAGEQHLGELRKKAADDGVSEMVRNMTALITANDATPALRANGERMVAEWTKQAKALSAVGALGDAARLIADAKTLQDALHPADSGKWFAEQERLIKGLALSGELSAGRIGQLKDEAVQWRNVAAALGTANPQYERYLQLAKTADDLVRAQANLSTTSSRAASAFAKAFGSPTVVSPGDSARSGLLADLIPSPKDLAAQLRYTIAIAVDDVKNSPAVQWAETAKQLGDDMGKRLGQGLGQGLTAGFAAAFSGKGVIGFIEGFGDSMLAALGDIFIRQGEALISFSAIMKGLGIALANPITAPFAAAAEGVALIALGAALSAAAHGSGGGSSYGGASGGGSFMTPSYLTFGVQAQSPPTTSLAAPTARPTMVFNVIGNDPKVQRDIATIVNSASKRGLIE